MPIHHIISLLIIYCISRVYMNSRRSIIRFVLLTAIFVISGLTGIAQDDPWLRVFTDEQSVIDVNRSSLVLESNRVIRAEFRTQLSTPEPVPEKLGINYQTRLDSIQFSVKDDRYRIAESKLLDESGKTVMSYSSSDIDNWKSLGGRTARRLFSAAGQLQPFGVWRVVTYRYASGELPSDQDPPELTSLVGSDILFNLDRLVVRNETCSSPVFEPRTITDTEVVKRLGSSITALGIASDKLDAILIACKSKNNSPVQTFMLRLPDNKALMLWDGVFLEMERTKNIFLP